MRINLMKVFNLPLLPVLKQEEMALYFKISLPCLFWVTLGLLAEMNSESVGAAEITVLRGKELQSISCFWASSTDWAKRLIIADSLKFSTTCHVYLCSFLHDEKEWRERWQFLSWQVRILSDLIQRILLILWPIQLRSGMPIPSTQPTS